MKKRLFEATLKMYVFAEDEISAQEVAEDNVSDAADCSALWDVSECTGVAACAWDDFPYVQDDYDDDEEMPKTCGEIIKEQRAEAMRSGLTE